jgi:hypothetical protein
MSSTNRGGQRSSSDNYPTPKWCVRRLLEAYPDLLETSGAWLEPCAGTGDIIEAVREFDPKRKFTAVELRKPATKQLSKLSNVDVVCPQNYLTWITKKKFCVAITNPPFRLAQEVLERSLKQADDFVALLLRLNYVGSEKRFDFMSQQIANRIGVLPNRPPFSYNKQGKWGTDSIEYAWFIWEPANPVSEARLRMLALTSLEERKKR